MDNSKNRIPFIRDIKLTKRQFTSAAKECKRMKEENKVLAKRVLVDGEYMSHVAQEAGILPASLRQTILRIYRKHEKICFDERNMVSISFELESKRELSSVELYSAIEKIRKYGSKVIGEYN